jgi:FecR protein
MKFRHCYIAIVLIVSSPASAAPAPVCPSPAVSILAAACTSPPPANRRGHVIRLSERNRPGGGSGPEIDETPEPAPSEPPPDSTPSPDAPLTPNVIPPGTTIEPFSGANRIVESGDDSFPYDSFHAFTQPDAVCRLPATSPAATAFTGTVEEINGDVSYRTEDEDWCDAVVGLKLNLEDQIHTGPDSEARVRFSDGSFVLIKQLSEIALGTLAGDATHTKVQVLLRMGEVAAQVNPQKTLLADFSIRVPQATASVRGTKFEVAHGEVEPGRIASVITVDQGVVDVSPAYDPRMHLMVPAPGTVEVSMDAVRCYPTDAPWCRCSSRTHC